MGIKFVRNLEGFFEKYIEGFFNKKFSSGLQPVEIAKQLAKEMEDERSISVSRIYIPNNYRVYLHSEDYERVSSAGQTLRDELSEYLAEEAGRKDYTIAGKPVVDICMDEKIERGRFRVESSFTERVQTDSQVDENPHLPELSDTRIFDKVTPISIKKLGLSATLTVVEGPDAGVKVDIGFARVNIGRREGNELPLADVNTSRLHAYIACEEGLHVLYDAKSLNGTYVNTHRMTSKELQTGDHIKLGNTVILYEVK